jgi:hypothetical protein
MRIAIIAIILILGSQLTIGMGDEVIPVEIPYDGDPVPAQDPGYAPVPVNVSISDFAPGTAALENGISSADMVAENPELQKYIDAGYTPSQIEFLARE